MGALASNQVEAMGIGKVLAVALMLGILGATLLPDSWKWIAWWTPVFWMYDVLRAIFTESCTWASLGWKSGVIVGLTFVYFLLLRKKIVNGLS